MTSQTLDAHEEISKIQTSQNPMYDTKSKLVYGVASSCSCPQCNSIDCFEIRYEKGNALCTCSDCKNMFSRKNDEEEDRQRDPLNIDTKSDLPNKKSDEKIYPELTRDSVKKDSQIASIKQTDDKIYFELIRKVNKEDERKDTLHANTKLYDFVNKKPKGESCHDEIKKVVKEDKQKDPVITYIKCDHLNKKNDTKTCCTITKKFYKSYQEKDKQNKSDFTYKKLDGKSYCEILKRGDKLCEQKGTANTCTTSKSSHKTSDDISYPEITKDIIEEREKKGTMNKHNKTEKSEVDLCDMTFIKNDIKKRESSFEESYMRNYGVAMTHTRTDDPTTALSAQIMDLPYETYKDSLLLHKPIDSVNANKIKKPDILAKLKEIYKACSCKICECIPSYSATNDASKVNTCGCKDSKYKHNIHNTQRDSHNSQHDCTRLPHSSASYRCDRKDCRGVWKDKMETAILDCAPCKDVNFSKSFIKPCDCEPCQCAECAALNFHIPRPVILAPVQGNFQQSLCQCKQCECVHCIHNFMREASTDMASHRNCNCDRCANNGCQVNSVDCICDTQKRIVRKPIDRSMRDYDLHPTLVEEYSFSRKRSVKIKKCDTVAMFTFSNNYSNIGFNKSRDNSHCMDCECIICKDNEKYESRVKNSYEGIPLAFSNLSAKSYTTCKCQFCECQLCCKDVKAESDKMLATRAVNNCGCDSCECISCKGLPYCSQNKEINDNSKSGFKNKLVDNSVETFTDFCNNISTDYFYPLKKGKLLTPSMFEAKILSNRQFQSHSSLPDAKKPLPNYLDISNIDTLSKHCDNIIEHNTICCNTNAIKYVNNTIEAPSTSFIFPKKSSAISVDNTINEMNNYNHRNMEANNNDVKLLNSIQISNDLITSKGKTNSDVGFFCSRISSFEKSILQIQEDISQSRKALAEICSKNGLSHDNFSEDNAATSFYDVISGKSLSSIHKTNLIDPPQHIENYKEPGIVTNSENDKIGEIVNNTKTLLDSIDNFNYLKYDQNENLSKGDNKLYTKLKKYHINVNKLRRNVARSRVKKLSRNSENKTIDFINEHVKENYRHDKNILNRKYSTKSASTSHDNILMAEQQKLKFKGKNEYSQTDIYSYQGNGMPWSVLQKNLYINQMPVTHRGICTIPDFELHIKRAVQSISMQTNETQGYTALTNLQTRVSKLLNSPLLQLKTYYRKSDPNEENTDLRPKSKLDLKLKHNICVASSQTHKHTLLVDKETNYDIEQFVEEMNIDMTKLVDLLLARTVCKSELTRPFNRIPEKPEVSKIKSVKSASEGLKVRLLGLRRVSDHTVLVRWKMPLQIEDVQGYELQVDGRPVQKILSPTRCIAVLTCLPHCEKVILSIRTLTFSALPSDHHPAATIIYRPREKRSRYHRLNFVEELQ